MVIFLTGERGVGKSTALRRAVAGCGLGIGGFMTDFGESRYAENKTLRLLPWSEEPDLSAGETCALLGPGGRQVFPVKSMTNPHSKLLCLLPGFQSLRRRPVPQIPITM